jgi:hypothetical protein
MPRLSPSGIVLALSLLTATPGWAQSDCSAPANWTSHQAVPPPDPANAPSSNCAFHVWAWQTYLWMTQPGSDGLPRFLSFPTPAETFAPQGPAPASATAASPRTLQLTVLPSKSSDQGKSSALLDLEGILQAGSRGMLIHRDGRAIYYSINMNSTYYDFIRGKKYFDPDVYVNAPDTENFPIGTLEFKYAWRIVQEGEDTSKFFVRPAEINLLVERDGKVVVDPKQKTTVNVALVGAHVVGVVKDHPEFIWATFEHVENAPDLPSGILPNSDTPVSDKDWTFYKAGIPAKDSNQPNANKVKIADPAKQTLTPITHVFRQFAWGSQPSDDRNAQDIVALNSAVRTQTLAGAAVWRNYMLIGGTWLPPNSLRPNENYFLRAVASTRLSNATMETFTQTLNCFGCHSTRGSTRDGVTLPPKNMNISHAMTDAFFNAKRAANAGQ